MIELLLGLGCWEGNRTWRAQDYRGKYERAIGPIPFGLQLDHLCRNELCDNPFGHLEPVTNQENAQRSPLIGRNPASHQWAGKGDAPCRRNHSPNWRTNRKGARVCRSCQVEALERFHAKAVA